MTPRSLAAMAASLLIGAMNAQAQMVVIVSAKNPISKLVPDQITPIFLGQSLTFYNGGKAEALDLAEGSPLRDEFYRQVTGKSAAQLKAHWAKQTFSGKGQPPKALASSEEVVKTVAENPKYIGYVNKAAVNATVKVVFGP